ncbi:MAG: hydroxymethylbilane synthase [Candidatus Eisenbacteria bacterium]|nr:hydroxymethylbilane synthase [Candidatus Eisenbacteria bacterium]
MAARRTLRLGVLAGRLGEIQAAEILKNLRRRSRGLAWDATARPVKRPRRGRGDETGEIPVREFYSEPLHQALMAGEIDVAVHRMKDFPAFLPADAAIAAVLPRKTPLDVLVALDNQILDDLPPGVRISVSSLRRMAQLRQYRADVEFVYGLGEVEERLERLNRGEVDGVVLAAAGMEWLGLQDRVSEVFTIELSVPAAGQGALGLVTRADDREAIEAVRGLNDALSRREIKAERAFLRTLEAWPGAPVGALGRLKGDILRLEGVICSPGGEHVLRMGTDGSPDDPAWVGEHLARQMLRELGREILDIAREEL